MKKPIVSPEQMSMSVDNVLGKFTEWWRMMKEAGLPFKALQRPIDDPDFRNRLVDFWMSSGKQKVAALDRPKPLNDLISAGSFDYVNPNISEASFPEVGIGHDFKVYDFKKAVSSEYAIKQMAKDDYRPADLRELLIWTLANWNGKDRVVALGQIWLDANGYCDVPYVEEWRGKRELDLDYLDRGWDGRSRFLALRKS